MQTTKRGPAQQNCVGNEPACEKCETCLKAADGIMKTPRPTADGNGNVPAWPLTGLLSRRLRKSDRFQGDVKRFVTDGRAQLSSSLCISNGRFPRNRFGTENPWSALNGGRKTINVDELPAL
jgi:hypothetical protein